MLVKQQQTSSQEMSTLQEILQGRGHDWSRVLGPYLSIAGGRELHDLHNVTPATGEWDNRWVLVTIEYIAQSRSRLCCRSSDAKIGCGPAMQ